jgi:tetratricopeptide (TPR) repeat protein
LLKDTTVTQLNQYKKGSEAYRTLLRQRPHDATIAAEIARICNQRGDANAAIKVLTDCLKTNIEYAETGFPTAMRMKQKQRSKPQNVAVGQDEEGTTMDEEAHDQTTQAEYFLQAQLHLCNIIGEVRIGSLSLLSAARASHSPTDSARLLPRVTRRLADKLSQVHMSRGAFEKTITMIRALDARDVCPPEQGLPLDLSMKVGICLAYLSKGKDQDLLSQAEEQFARLYKLVRPTVACRSSVALCTDARALMGKQPAETYPDLYLDVAEAFAALGFHRRAIKIYLALLPLPEYDQPGIWLKLGRCHRMLLTETDDTAASAAGQAADSALQGTSAGEMAADFYRRVLDAVPDSCEAALAIAEIYREAVCASRRLHRVTRSFLGPVVQGPPHGCTGDAGGGPICSDAGADPPWASRGRGKPRGCGLNVAP